MLKSRNAKELFLRKSVLHFCSIEDGMNITTINKKAGCLTYSACSNLIKKYDELGLIKKESEKRNKYIFLTDKGRELQDMLKSIILQPL